MPGFSRLQGLRVPVLLQVCRVAGSRVSGSDAAPLPDLGLKPTVILLLGISVCVALLREASVVRSAA